MNITNIKVNYKTNSIETVRQSKITGAVDIQLSFKLLLFSEKWYYSEFIMKFNKVIEAILKRFLNINSVGKYIIILKPVNKLKYDFMPFNYTINICFIPMIKIKNELKYELNKLCYEISKVNLC